MFWFSWISLGTVINLLSNQVKAGSCFKPKKMVMHVYLWGNYLNKLEKNMLWSPVLLKLHYNHNQLIYNHNEVIYNLLWDAKYGVPALRQFFSLYVRKMQKITALRHACMLMQN